MQLTENEIRGLCLKSREIFLSQPILLELEAPLKICGKPLLRTSLLPENSPYFCRIARVSPPFSPLLAPGSSLHFAPFSGSQVTSMASTMTFYGCLNMVVSLQRATTSSWGTM